MNPTLRSMLFTVGAVTLGGVAFVLYTPQPATRSMAELRDAGITDPAGQRLVLTCPERLTTQTKRRINSLQPGLLRPKQSYARIARVAVCFNPDGGNCFRPADFAPRVADLEGVVIVPSLRQNLTGVDLDAGVADPGDGGEADTVDDSLQYGDCTAERCNTYDAGGLFANGTCGNINRLWLVPSPCMVPNCWVGDGGTWQDDAVVDCRWPKPNTDGTSGPLTWRGCNVGPAATAVGTQCVPTECSVIAGDFPPDWL